MGVDNCIIGMNERRRRCNMVGPASLSSSGSSPGESLPISPFSYSEKLKEFVKAPVFGKLTKPGTVKKTMHIVRKLIFTVDLYSGKVHCYELCKGMKTFGDMLDFYGSYKNIVGWVEYFSCPFSQKTLDKEKAQDSLKTILTSQKIFNVKGEAVFKDKRDIDAFVKKVVDRITTDENYRFNNPEDARKFLKSEFVTHLKEEASRPKVVRNMEKASKQSVETIGLLKKGSSSDRPEADKPIDRKEENERTIIIDEKHIDSLVQAVTIKQKSHSTALFIALGCFTVSDLGDNILTLQKWGVIDLSRFSSSWGACAAHIGTKVPIFAFVGRVTLGTALSVTSSVALTLIIGINGYQGAQALLKYLDQGSTEEEVKNAKKKMWSTSVCIVDASVSLAVTVAPLCFTFNPFLGIVVLPVASKVTGLMRTFLL